MRTATRLFRAVEYIIDGTGPAEAHAILDANAMALFRIND
jgi:hypothetical protein